MSINMRAEIKDGPTQKEIEVAMATGGWFDLGFTDTKNNKIKINTRKDRCDYNDVYISFDGFIHMDGRLHICGVMFYFYFETKRGSVILYT